MDVPISVAAARVELPGTTADAADATPATTSRTLSVCQIREVDGSVTQIREVDRSVT